jgi:6-phosphogluconolactonase
LSYHISANMGSSNATLVYVGTNTARTKSKGIYVFRLQTENLEVSQNITLVPMGLAAEAENPSFLELDFKRRILYAVNQISKGAVSAFKIDSDTGKLTLLGRRDTKGASPCHLALDQTGRHLAVGHFDGGTVAILPVAADGQPGDPTDAVEHTGKSIDPKAQTGPHPHCSAFSPDNQFVFVCDMGLDKIMRYKFDAAMGKLTPGDPPFIATKPGAGPRHMVFRPDGRFVYVVNSINSTVDAYSYDASAGMLKPIQNISTLPGYYDGPNSAAEIDVHPSGKWLYVSNRGNNTVVLFEIDAANGALTYIEEQGTGGNTPRHFGIQPNAKHMVIANQDTHTLLACRIDSGNGRLKPSGVFAEAPSPTCAKFLPPPE